MECSSSKARTSWSLYRTKGSGGQRPAGALVEDRACAVHSGYWASVWGCFQRCASCRSVKRDRRSPGHIWPQSLAARFRFCTSAFLAFKALIRSCLWALVNLRFYAAGGFAFTDCPFNSHPVSPRTKVVDLGFPPVKGPPYRVFPQPPVVGACTPGGGWPRLCAGSDPRVRFSAFSSLSYKGRPN